MNPLKIAHTWRKENSSMPEILVTFKTFLSASKFFHESVDFKGWGKRILKSHGLHSQPRWLSGIIIGITAPPPPHIVAWCVFGVISLRENVNLMYFVSDVVIESLVVIHYGVYFCTWSREFLIFQAWIRETSLRRDGFWTTFMWICWLDNWILSHFSL